MGALIAQTKVTPRFTEAEADATLLALTATIAESRRELEDLLGRWSAAKRVAEANPESTFRARTVRTLRSSIESRMETLNALSAARIALSDAIA